MKAKFPPKAFGALPHSDEAKVAIPRNKHVIQWEAASVVDYAKRQLLRS